MDAHVRRLGILSIVFGLACGVGAIALLVYYGGVSEFYYAYDSFGWGMVFTALLLFNLLLALPTAVLGYFVMTFNDWARSAMVVLCALQCVNAPLGWILGVYGFWVLTQPETEPLFLDRPDQRKRVGKKRQPPTPPEHRAIVPREADDIQRG